MEKIAFGKSISTKILGTLLLVSVIAIFLTGITLVSLSGTTLRRNISQRNLQIARRAAKEIGLYIETSIEELQAMAEILEAFPDPWIRTLLLESYGYSLRKFTSLILVDGDGTIVAHSGLGAPSTKAADALFTFTLKDKEYFLSEVAVSEENLPYMMIAVPLGPRSAPSHIMAAELNLRDIWDLVDDTSFGSSSQAALTTLDDILIAHPDKTKVLSRAEDYAFDAQAPWDDEGTTFVHKIRGARPILVSCSPVEIVSWRVVIQQPLKDAYLPRQIVLYRSLGILAVIMLIAIVSGLYLARRFFSPLNNLLDGTLRIGRGDLDYHIAIQSEDEIGRLSRSFNSMVGELKSYRNRLRSLASQLTITEARERKRIAGDLHDRIAQSLALTTIKLSSLKSSQITAEEEKALKDALRLVDQAIQDTRSMIYSLSSPLLYEVGLHAALDQMIEQFQIEHSLKVHFHDDGKPKAVSVDNSILLFQATRELLVNVVKHAKAKEVWVTMHGNRDTMEISVRDDGVGFDSLGKAFHVGTTGGYGLFSIKERIDYAGGSFHIDSNSSTGTRITLGVSLESGKGSNK